MRKALVLAVLLLSTACAATGPVKSSMAPGAEQIRLKQGQPYWLDNATRKRSLAIMSFEKDPVKVVVGFLDKGETTTHTLGIDDKLAVDGTDWRVSEIDPAADGYAVLTSN